MSRLFLISRCRLGSVALLVGKVMDKESPLSDACTNLFFTTPPSLDFCPNFTALFNVLFEALISRPAESSSFRNMNNSKQ